MKNFLFEQYGYGVKELIDNSFYIDNFYFNLIETNLEEENVMEMEKYIELIKNNFNNIGPHIIKNKFNKHISYLVEDKYLLISVYKKNMNLNDLYKFHNMFYKHDEYIELDKVLEVWKERVDKIEKNLSSYLKVDSIEYSNNLNKSMFVIGLAINAMQYLSDIINDYSSRLYGITIVHKRIKGFSSFDFLNPLNFIVDSPCKDIGLLYQNNMINIMELEALLDVYNIDTKGASFLLARILYKCDVFDYLEKKKDIERKVDVLDVDIEKEVEKIKKAYHLLKNKFDIRPIDWLEN